MPIAMPLAPALVDLDDDEGNLSPDLSITAGDDGNVVVDLNPQRKDDKGAEFDENLALEMDDSALAVLAEELLAGIESDIQSRTEMETTRARGIDLLGLRIEEPRGDVGESSAPLEGMSTVRNPLLLEAVLRSQSNASGELLPASGPAKIDNAGDETAQTDEQAEFLETDFNHYLTHTATEYYPDTRRTLFWSSFGGAGFKKLYHCPLRRRPVSEFGGCERFDCVQWGYGSGECAAGDASAQDGSERHEAHADCKCVPGCSADATYSSIERGGSEEGGYPGVKAAAGSA